VATRVGHPVEPLAARRDAGVTSGPRPLEAAAGAIV
jgi:hypothetical protein